MSDTNITQLGRELLAIHKDSYGSTVADAEEAAALVAARDAGDRVPYAGLAFYAGLRRSASRRLEWPDVELDETDPADRLNALLRRQAHA